MQPRKFVPHPFTYHQELEVRIENLTNEGSGVARVDGWVSW
jgi:23S rRNA (uracil1939-C5)-methyltransferase/tRNA (uracil-5-)-methyltransferase